MYDPEFDDYVELRWGDVGTNLAMSNARLHSRRAEHLWQAIQTLTGTSEREPSMIEVHSPHAWPAFVTWKDREALVWDAGLGTLLWDLAFPQRHPQPSAVIEAKLRQVAAVRLVALGDRRQAGYEVNEAMRLINSAGGIDRSYARFDDAESKFDRYLMGELQERFVHSHELAHYLKAVDPTAFANFEAEVLRTIELLDTTQPPARSVLFDLQNEPLWEYAGENDLAERGVNPYRWYVTRGGETIPRSTAPWAVEVSTAKVAVNDDDLVEEVTCDAIATLAVCLDAARRRMGWTLDMAFACCRLALANMTIAASVDARLIPSRRANEKESNLRTRTSLFDVTLPRLLHEFVAESDRISVEDAYAIATLVGDANCATYSDSIGKLWRARGGRARERRSNEQILVLAGFIYLPRSVR